MQPIDLSLFRQHLEEISKRYEVLSSQFQVDCVIVTAGSSAMYYADDQAPPFHANPHFLQWVPWEESEHAVLVWEPSKTPVLLFYSPDDYWYLPSSPQSWMEDCFEVEVFKDSAKIWERVQENTRHLNHRILIGPSPSDEFPDQVEESVKHASFVHAVDRTRAIKTDFELDCMKKSTARAIKGHNAAQKAFREGKSEYGVHIAYLDATQQTEARLPYPNIIAFNEHASVLHYQLYDLTPPDPVRSLLIDAGAKYLCYHSDITRTYASYGQTEFQDLVDAVDSAQRQITYELEPKAGYQEVHLRMHELIAEVLVDQNILHCSPASAFDQELTDVFFPHGLGHLLGLQTHDVGGYIHEDDSLHPPPERFNSLRLTRRLETNLVTTIEPGIYFIPILLDKKRGHSDINWSKVERLTPYGGVRIEDNVYFDRTDKLVNMTRDAFADTPYTD